MTWTRGALVAILMALGFPPVCLWPLSWFAFFYFCLPLLSETPHTNPGFVRRSALYFASYAFFVNIFGFYWLAYTLKEFGGVPWVGAIPFVLLIFALFSLISMAAGAAWGRLSPHLVGRSIFGIDLRPLGLIALLLVWDWLDVRLFPWTPAMSVGSDPLLLASVHYLGTWGWRLVFYCLVVFLAYVWTAPAKSVFAHMSRRRLVTALAVVFVFASAYTTGYFARVHLQKKYSARQPVALVQGNVGNYEKKLSKLGVAPTIANVMAIHRELIERVSLHYEALGAQAVNQNSPAPEIWVVWPETSFPGFPLVESDMTRTLRQWTKLVGGLNIVGAYENTLTEFAGQQVPLDFNITALFHESVGYVSHAQKIIRIPFGEYIPLDEYFPDLYKLLPAVNHFGAGAKYTPLAHPAAQGPVFVPVVCYEVLYSWFVDRYVDEAKKQFPSRPLVLVNPTNDSWYGLTSEPFQHSLLARWSTVRQGIPSMRPTNTGLSQIIAPWGEVIAQGPQDESTVVFGMLPVEKTLPRGLAEGLVDINTQGADH